MSRKDNEAPLKDLIDKFMKAYNLDGRMKEMNIRHNWEEIVGPAIFRRTESVQFNGSVLLLKVKSSVMRQELLLIKSDLIAKINEYAGESLVSDVWIS